MMKCDEMQHTKISLRFNTLECIQSKQNFVVGCVEGVKFIRETVKFEFKLLSLEKELYLLFHKILLPSILKERKLF